MNSIEFLKELKREGYNTAEIMKLEKIAFSEAKAAHEGQNHSAEYLRDIGREFVLDNLELYEDEIGKSRKFCKLFQK